MIQITIQSVADADYFKIKKYPAEFFDAKPKAYELSRGGLNEDTAEIPVTARNVHNGGALFTNVLVSDIEVNGETYETYEELSAALTPILFKKGGGSGGGGTFEGIVTQDTDTVNFTGNGKVGSPLKADSVNNYSLQETKTGGTWIDGKPIYRKVINTTETNTNVANLNIDTVVSQITKLNTLTFDSNIPSPNFFIGAIFNSYLEITRVDFEEDNETPQDHLVYFVGTKIAYGFLQVYGICTVIKSSTVDLVQNVYDSITATSTIILEYTKTTD